MFNSEFSVITDEQTYCWYRILFVHDLRVGLQKIQKYCFFFVGPREHPEWRGITHLDTRVPKVPFLAKMPLVNLRLTEGQMKSKPSQNNIFHSFTSNMSFSEIFNNFDKVWPGVDLKGPKNPNFDLAIRVSWNQCHCKYYQILIPTTIRG